MQSRRGKTGRQTILDNGVFSNKVPTAYASYDDLLSGMDGHINHHYMQQAGPYNSFDQLRNAGQGMDDFGPAPHLQADSQPSEPQTSLSSLEDFNFDTGPPVTIYHEDNNGFHFSDQNTGIAVTPMPTSYSSNDLQSMTQLHNVDPSLYPYMTNGDGFALGPDTSLQDAANDSMGIENPLRLMEVTKTEAMTPGKRLPFLDTEPTPTPVKHGTWRRPSKSRSMHSVKRSQSTPNVQLAAAAAAAAGSDIAAKEALELALSDKKKNKLGYHRTSIACGHCRRRKIRCMLPKDDIRCQNCIRLKKDCNFFPVETTERRPRSASKPDIGPDCDNQETTSSGSSSPNISLSLNKLPRHSMSDMYPGSQPMTPNNEYPTSLNDGLRHRSLSSAGRLSIAHSNAASRRPSLAHMYTAPLPSREFRSSSESSPNYNMMGSASFADRFGERLASGLAPDESLIWRTSAPMTTSGFVSLPQQVNFGMPPLNEHPLRQSRFNSVDNGIDPTSQFAFGLSDTTNSYASSLITSSPVPDSSHALKRDMSGMGEDWQASNTGIMTRMVSNHEQLDGSWFLQEESDVTVFTNDHTQTLLHSPLGMSGIARGI